MTEQPTTPPKHPRRDGLVWSQVAGGLGDEPYTPPARTRPSRWAKTGTAGAKANLAADEQPVAVPARPYGVTSGCDESGDNRHPVQHIPSVDLTKPGFATGGVIHPTTDSDVVPVRISRCLYEHGVPTAPPAVELLAMANDLNANGGLDETFVAALLREAADPLADAKRGLGIVDPPTPITYDEIVSLFTGMLPPPLPFDTIKLTQAQIDAFPHTRQAAPSDAPWHFFGTPVELVDTVEESTPYQLANAQPGGIIEIHGHLTEPEFEPLRADWRAVDAKPMLPRWLVDADREFVEHVNDGVDRGAVLDAVRAAADEAVAKTAPYGPKAEFGAARRPAKHQHIWTTTSPVRCVECRRYLRPWWRRALDRARRWGW